jgi:hypothetical protein
VLQDSIMFFRLAHQSILLSFGSVNSSFVSNVMICMFGAQMHARNRISKPPLQSRRVATQPPPLRNRCDPRRVSLLGKTFVLNSCTEFFNQKMRAYFIINLIKFTRYTNIFPDELARRVHVLAKFNYSVCSQVQIFTN